MTEIWKEIPVTSVRPQDGYYDASNLGRIRRTDRKTPKIVKPVISKQGHELIVLPSKNRRPVAQLVLHAFRGLKPEGKFRMRHKDGDISNNRLDNLEWQEYE